ncbi:hypothetical protein P3B99_009870 [Opitutia bacterium KCR 482]|nr:hypothetical protein [Opitutae bacterium KCR 482]MDY5582849.1 hypothetical protein [Candidatus Merdousia sp.]
MRETNKYIRRTISISPHVDEILNKGADREFGGNFSAFLAHIVLEYIKCKNCFSRQIGENCAPAPRRGKCAKVAENALAADDR